MTTINLRAANATGTRADVLVIGAATTPEGLVVPGPGEPVARAFGRGFEPTLSSLGFAGKQGDVAKLPSVGVVKSPLVIVVGLGEQEAITAESLRRAAGVAVRSIRNSASAAFALPSTDERDVQAICEGVLLGGYAFGTYKSEDESAAHRIATATVLTASARSKDAQQALAAAVAVSQAVNRARDWINTPPRDLTPALFAEAVAAIDAPSRVKVTVWDEPRLAKENCGGILGVGQGSENPPRLVQVTYRPRKPVTHIALVGKGITYDSGGITLKPAAGLMTMKCDMSGAAAVIAATFAAAALELPVQITCWAAMAENMPSGTATRPGDVLKLRNGATVEVHNTDAEGRLVLADALCLAVEEGPDMIVDVATLTGACVVALGTRTAGVLSNDDGLRNALPATAQRVGESMWPLPITEEMKTKVRSSSVADLRQHNPEPYGGTLFAAGFLREFVDGQRWAHIDIAGPAFNDGEPHGYTPKGGTGAGVRTLVHFMESLAESGGSAS
ncbi:MAG: leucyl aminopeptidase [Actinomycetota bacterium]|nr:leucyl aminopeptidase [Actinomycetota bacterium]